jgi:hypothetical protein
MELQGTWNSYEEFWQAFGPIVSEKLELAFGAPPKGKDQWYFRRIPQESNATYNFQVSTARMSIYVVIEANQKKLSATEKADINREIFDQLVPYKSSIEAELGFPLVWERDKYLGDGLRESCRIYHEYKPINCLDKSNFNQVSTFLIGHMQKVIQVFDKHFLIAKLENPTVEVLEEISSSAELMNESNFTFQRLFALQEIRGRIQVAFRTSLMKVYKQSCAVCGLSFEEALEAAHIIPYSVATNHQRLDLQNGILLCAVHHKLFDKGLITIDQDYTIHCKQSKSSTDYDNLMLTKFHLQKLKLPENKNQFPNKSYLETHRVRWKG